MKTSAPRFAETSVLGTLSEAHAQALQDGALSRKTKELIALTTAVATHCEPSIAYHLHNALQARATTQEVTEALEVTMVTMGEPVAIHADRVVKALHSDTIDETFSHEQDAHPYMEPD